jgi:hypothetical protein
MKIEQSGSIADSPMEDAAAYSTDGRSQTALGHTIQCRLNRENMTHLFFCPYLANEVELTEEREQHITATHPLAHSLII